MNWFSNISAVILVVSVSACATLNTGKASKDKKYYEDLSSYLPENPVDTVSAVNETENEQVTSIDSTLNIRTRLDSVLTKVNTYTNETTNEIEGLSIQIYAGNDRSKAKEVQLRAIRYFPDDNPKIIFDQPNYKVRMGAFYSHLEAYPVFKSVQAKFSKAILVPERIPIAKEDSN